MNEQHAVRLAVCTLLTGSLCPAPAAAMPASDQKAFGDATVIVGERVAERGRTVVVPVSVFGEGATVRLTAEACLDDSHLPLVAVCRSSIGRPRQETSQPPKSAALIALS